MDLLANSPETRLETESSAQAARHRYSAVRTLDPHVAFIHAIQNGGVIMDLPLAATGRE